VLIVAPEDFDPNPYLLEGLADQFEVDPGLGLAEAINAGFKSLPSGVSLVNWLGDDDLLTAGSLEITSGELLKHPEIDLVFGSCDYIDTNGNKIWTNNSGQWAVPLLRFGPDMIPQPGALFQKEAFLNVGGLNTNFSWAFDFDLFIKLSKIGKVRYVDETLASFRWHPESLSVEFRSKSVAEASQVRVSHLPTWLRIFSPLWEYPVKWATLVAGNRVTIKAKRAIA
jgi:hypothetical protein